MGLDEYRIPGLNSLTEEMEKKKLTADAFNLFFLITVFMVCDPILSIE